MSAENGTDSWPLEDQWLETLIRGQRSLALSELELTALLDHKWWDLVAESLDGIDEPFMRKQLATMALWLQENPRKRPRPGRGWKKFMRGWLERAQERERKNIPTVKRGWR